MKREAETGRTLLVLLTVANLAALALYLACAVGGLTRSVPFLQARCSVLFGSGTGHGSGYLWQDVGTAAWLVFMCTLPFARGTLPFLRRAAVQPKKKEPPVLRAAVAVMGTLVPIFFLAVSPTIFWHG